LRARSTSPSTAAWSASTRPAAQRKRAGKDTNLDRRVDNLVAAIIGKRHSDDPSLVNLRYQVFSAIAGTVAAAKPTTTAAAVVIHLIGTEQAKPRSSSKHGTPLRTSPTPPVYMPRKSWDLLF
jgi:hypothetical protein